MKPKQQRFENVAECLDYLHQRGIVADPNRPLSPLVVSRPTGLRVLGALDYAQKHGKRILYDFGPHDWQTPPRTAFLKEVAA